MKKRAYQQRVLEVEHASFTPVVLSATGGMANEATLFYKRIVSRLSQKWVQPCSNHDGLATLQNHFCTPAFCHSMPARSKIEQTSRQQILRHQWTWCPQSLISPLTLKIMSVLLQLKSLSCYCFVHYIIYIKVFIWESKKKYEDYCCYYYYYYYYYY